MVFLVTGDSTLNASLRRCDCGVFGDLGVAGFASRGIQLTI